MIDALREVVANADAVALGAGSGLSAAAGIEYSGPRFTARFGDLMERHGLTDMYSAGFHPFPTQEERWAYWSRHIAVNRYDVGPLPLYERLRELLEGTEHFVITSNVDHAFQLAGFDEDAFFAVQGDYGLFPCSVPCRQETWGNEAAVRRMVAEQREGRIPSELIPRCPGCGALATTNLHIDERFVEDEQWHRSAERWRDFSRAHRTGRVLYLEIGVGLNTPGVIKVPFWQRTHDNPESTYLVVNPEPIVPNQIEARTIALPVSIGELLPAA